MKKCTYCGKEYADENLLACPVDGQPLVSFVPIPASVPAHPPSRPEPVHVAGAIALTLIVLFASAIVSALIHFPLVLLIVPATAVWAVLDVTRLRKAYAADPSFVASRDVMAMLQTSRPIIVFAACFLVWLFGFPWYLVMRGRLMASAPAPKEETHDVVV